MKLSIIVCTYNRAYAIGPCLDSIAAALSAAAPVEAEIVVVDNASTDDTSTVIKKWAETCAFPVQALYEPKKGVSAARNCAIRAARGDLLAFTDDDCRPSKDYVRDVLRHDAADTEPVLRGGRVELGDPTDLPLSIKTDLQAMRWHRRLNSTKHENIANSIVGCNMVMHRKVMERLGFFDERLGAGTSLPGGEDTDYIFRAYIAGILIEYVPDMTIFHYHGRKSADAAYKLFRNYMLGNGALYVKYIFKEPTLCRQFYWDFKNMMRDMIAGKNNLMPDINFSYKDKILFSLHGAFKYCFVVVRKLAS